MFYPIRVTTLCTYCITLCQLVVLLKVLIKLIYIFRLYIPTDLSFYAHSSIERFLTLH